MSIGNVVQDFLNKGLECSIVNSFIDIKTCGSQTLAFKIKEKIILIVTDKDKEISVGKFLHYFKASPSMLSKNETREITGHPIGCLSPFGLKNHLKVYIDVSLKRNDYISVCAGMKNFVINVTPGEMIEVTGGEWIDIWEN
ncbi:hypothetical protein LGK95_15140 [Clostridium algoriphilum]|uniref:YbaK/EbsC family protein n=1 Tax=Clostridium algoriphilum TaxID=198347 RepID=UPI001CF3190F|nr:YbaK/EbsC family protein [Clostridium algoriphilum]MCB2294834.1 hypothetical protein [Clostridium algoriphilum]